jgi:hypothetical protein
MSDQSDQTGEDVTIETTPQAQEQVSVSMESLLADGYQPEPDDRDYVA